MSNPSRQPLQDPVDAGGDERHARLRDHMDSALAHIRDYAIVLIGDDGRIASWNRGAEQLLGYTHSEAIGQSIDIFFTPEDVAAGIPGRELGLAAEHGEANDERWHRRRNGSRFFGSGVVSAVRDDEQRLLGFVKIFRDLTERRRVELERERLLRQATEANRLKDEFLSTVSHELRTPLNAIMGWMQLVKLRQASPAHVAEGLAVIERNAHAQARLIDDLLDMSRILSGKVRLTLAPVSLAESLDAAIETVKPMAEQKGITLTVHHRPGSDPLTADGERLQQIIWNLLSNAIKFTPPGGSIVVTTTSSDGAIDLCVQDSGIGIDPAFLPLVFDRFRQADTAYAKENGGLGLGLSIVKHLVELHGGTVSITSPGRGRGTTVCLSLPRAQAAKSA